MKHLTFYFVIFLLLAVDLKSSSVKLVNYYAYLIPERNIIICSNKPRQQTPEVLNEFENGSGFTCLVNLKSGRFFKISLHLSKAEESKTQMKKLIDVGIGDSILSKGIDLQGDSAVTKEIFIKLENRRVLYSVNCQEKELERCNFKISVGSIFMKRFLKLNFNLISPAADKIVLLERKTKVQEQEEECDPPCIYGVCHKEMCMCQLGYTGMNCSVKLQPKEFRVKLPVFIIFLIVAALLGALLMWLLFKLFLFLFGEKEYKEISKEVDFIERWEKT